MQKSVKCVWVFLQFYYCLVFSTTVQAAIISQWFLGELGANYCLYLIAVQVGNLSVPLKLMGVSCAYCSFY